MSGGSTRLFLVRHGETVWHHDDRYAGAASDIDLTPLGLRQADGLAAWAARRAVGAVVSSPVRRAVETAEPTARALELPVEVEEDLREVDFGVAEGRTKSELSDLDAGMVSRFVADPVASPFPGSEPPERAADRVGAALRRIAAAHAGQDVLVVAHNTALRLGLCAVLDLPPRRYRQLFPRLENAALTEIVVPVDEDGGTGPASLVRLNAPQAAGDHVPSQLERRPEPAPAPRKEQR